MPDRRPTVGQLEERALDVSTDGRRLRGVIPYGAESRDMGGWTEIIEPGALRGANLDDLVCTIDHAGVPIGRHPRTLELEDRSDGLHWSVIPPASRADVIEAIERGDLAGGSWRMQVARDSWTGDVRHVHEIRSLVDVSVVTHPSYDAAAVELRSKPEEAIVPEDQNTETVATDTDATVSPVEPTETRSVPTPQEDTPRPAAGSLRVQDRASAPAARTLAEEFRHRGFPGERAVMDWTEYESRAVTWSGSAEQLNVDRRIGVPLGHDVRWAWPAFVSVGVEAGVTSVVSFFQAESDLASGSEVVRDLAATDTKPETSSEFSINTLDLKQVATVSSGIPNVYLQQPQIDTVIQSDLRLAINSGLDKLVLDGLATAGYQAPGSDQLLVSIRKAISKIQASGYQPDTLILDPASAEALDVLVTGELGAGGNAAANDYVFGPGAFAPGSLFGLNRRISKSAPAPAVVDSQAFGRLYASAASLARFEENAGATNTSLVRLELTAVFGVERLPAALRIAAS